MYYLSIEKILWFFYYKKKNLKEETCCKKKKVGVTFVYEFENEIYIEKSEEAFLHGLMKFKTSDFRQRYRHINY